MKVLVLSAVYPDSPSDGDRVRLYGFLDQLSQRHEITLLSFVDPARAADQAPLKLKRLKAVRKVKLSSLAKWTNAANRFLSEWPLNVEAYFSRDMEDSVDELLAQAQASGKPFELVHAYRLRMAPYALRFKGPRTIDFTDSLTRYAEHRLNNAKLAGKSWIASFRSREARKIASFETWCALQFDVSFMNGLQDAQTLRAMAPRARIEVAANGVSHKILSRPQKLKPDFVFVGHLAYAPNAAAVLWFGRYVLPLIRLKLPGAQFNIVGGDAPRVLRELAKNPGVNWVGFQPDTAPWLANACASVCPVSLAVGRQNKLIEALAAGTPVVATRVCAELAEALPGKHLLAADSAEEFAQACLRLAQDASLGRRLASAGRALARQKYDWTRNAQVIQKAWLAAIQKEGRA